MIFLVFAICLDMFVASVAYGTEKIKITRGQIAAVNVIASVCLGCSLCFGACLEALVPEAYTRGLCFGAFFLLGCRKLAQSLFGRGGETEEQEERRLSWREAVVFALALSLDNLIAGTLAAFLDVPVLPAVALTFVVGVLFTCLGFFLGRRLGEKCPRDLSWVGGVLFLFLAFFRR